MANSLSGKVALVTGGTRGIGAATALALAAEGADVAISYVASGERASSIVEQIAAKGGRAAHFQSDQSDRAAATTLVSQVTERFGRLDILVNNAAAFVSSIVGDPDPDIAALDRLYATNLHGVVAMIRAAAEVMEAGGRIITVSSNVVVRAGYTGFADYTATKAALTGYSKAAARDLAPRGITVNVLQSGPTATEMNPDDSELAQMLKRDSALGRYGRPEEIAAGILFLASPSASYVTGTVLEVDGGINA